MGTPFAEIALVLLAAALVGAMGTWLRQPLTVSFIAVGILVGPAGIGLEHAGRSDRDSLEGLLLLALFILLPLIERMLRAARRLDEDTPDQGADVPRPASRPSMPPPTPQRQPSTDAPVLPPADIPPVPASPPPRRSPRLSARRRGYTPRRAQRQPGSRSFARRSRCAALWC